MNTFGQNMRTIRECKNLSLDELAEKIGSTKQVLSRYERDERSPKISTAQAIAGALGVTLEALNGDSFGLYESIGVATHKDEVLESMRQFVSKNASASQSKKAKGIRFGDMAVSVDEQNLLRDYRMLKEKERKQLRMYMNALLDREEE